MSSMRCFSKKKKRTIADEEEESEGRIPLNPPTATPPPHFSNETINTVRNMADFGQILRTIGDFGLFQKLLLFALCFPNLILPFHLASVLFVQSDPVRRCNTDWILTADPDLTPEEQANLTLPRVTDGTFSRCEMFVPVDWDIDTIREYGLNETTECQNGWLYDKSMYEATIVTDFDLVCGKANLVQIAQTGLMAGILVGSLLFGPFAESFGRRRATQIPVVIMFVFTVTTGMCPNFYLYLLSQLMVGVGYGGFRVNCIVLATEWMGVTKRSFGSCMSQLFGAFGQCILAGIIYFIRDWRLAQWAIAAPLALVLIYIWFIPESARWLLDRGRTEEVKRLILRAAAINKRTVPESLLEKLTEDKPVEKGGIRVLIRSPILRKNFLTISFAWFSLNLAYYCLSFNMANLGLDIFLTQLVFGLSEVPAHILCIWLLEVLGRKLSLMGTMGIGGLSCILLLTVPQDNAVAVTSLAVTGRFLMNWAGSICNVYVQELFPTSVRQTATGLGAIGTRIAGLLSPLLNLLAMFHWSIPTVVFGSLSLTSGALTFMLPETRNKELPDSTEEAEGMRTMKPMKRGSDLRMSDHNIISSCKL